MYCPKCGNNVDGTKMYCSKCGNKISNNITKDVKINTNKSISKNINTQVNTKSIFVGIFILILVFMAFVFFKSVDYKNIKILKPTISKEKSDEIVNGYFRALKIKDFEKMKEYTSDRYNLSSNSIDEIIYNNVPELGILNNVVNYATNEKWDIQYIDGSLDKKNSTASYKLQIIRDDNEISEFVENFSSQGDYEYTFYFVNENNNWKIDDIVKN